MIDSALTDFAAHWLPIFVTVTLKTTIVLVIAGLLAAVGRRCSASTRHLVWSLAIGGAVALPVLAVFQPRWITVSIAPPAREVDRPAPRLDAIGATPALSTLDHQLAAAAKTGGPRQATARSFRLIPPVAWLALVWGGGVLFFTARLGLGMLALAGLTKRSTPMNDRELRSVMHRCCGALGRRGEVELRDGGHGQMPTTYGIRRAVVLLPTEALGWSQERIRAVLLHEIAHVVRRDCIMALVTQLACIVHWYNPAIWYARRRLIGEAERAADDLVIQSSIDPVDYADHLVSIARRFGRRSKATLELGMARGRDLEQRLHALLEASRNRHRVSRAAGVTAAHVTASLVLGLAGLTIVPAEAAPPDLDSDEETVRRTAVRALGRTGVARAYAPLANMLADDSIEVRAAAAGALGGLGDPRAVEPLIAMLSDREPLVREWAVRGLGTLADDRAVGPVIGMLADRSAPVREWTVRTLVNYDDARARTAIALLVDDEDRDVREWVARTIISAPAPAAALVLMLLADDEDGDVREWVARGLGTMGDPRAVETLIDMLGDDEREVREHAVRALGKLGDRRAVPPLLRLIDDEDAEIREWALRGLGRLPDPSSVGVLSRVVRSGTEADRRWAVRALSAIGTPRARRALERATHDEYPTVREDAMKALRTVAP